MWLSRRGRVPGRVCAIWLLLGEYCDSPHLPLGSLANIPSFSGLTESLLTQLE